MVRGLDGRYHVKRVCDPIAQHRAFRDLVFHPRILDVVERLIGPDIQLQQSRLILKPRTPDAWFDWHQDYPAFPHTNFDLLILTVYLDDASADNGCLTVIPGSHRLGPLPHRFTFEGAPRTELADRSVVADRSHWRNPDTAIVIDHLGLQQPFEPPPPAQPFADLPEVLTLAAHRNVAIKITGACTLSREAYPFKDIWDPLARILDAFGLERCLWGTDWTRAVGLLTYQQGVEAFRATDRLSESDKGTLMGGALQRVYSWSPTRA